MTGSPKKDAHRKKKKENPKPKTQATAIIISKVSTAKYGDPRLEENGRILASKVQTLGNQQPNSLLEEHKRKLLQNIDGRESKHIDLCVINKNV